MSSKNALGLNPLNVGILSPTHKSKPAPEDVRGVSSKRAVELFSFQSFAVLKRWRERSSKTQ